MCSAVSVDRPTAHSDVGQPKQRLCHTNRAGRPNTAKSTSSTSRWSLAHTADPQPGQVGRDQRASTCIRTALSSSSTAPSTVTYPRPTKSSQTRIRPTVTGVPGSVGVSNRQTRRAPVPRPRSSTPDPLPPQTRRTRLAAIRGVAEHLIPDVEISLPEASDNDTDGAGGSWVEP